MKRILVMFCVAGSLTACGDGGETTNANPDSTTNAGPVPNYGVDSLTLNDTSMEDTNKLRPDTIK